jgi:hypothetical protein
VNKLSFFQVFVCDLLADCRQGNFVFVPGNGVVSGMNNLNVQDGVCAP